MFEDYKIHQGHITNVNKGFSPDSCLSKVGAPFDKINLVNPFIHLIFEF